MTTGSPVSPGYRTYFREREDGLWSVAVTDLAEPANVLDFRVVTEREARELMSQGEQEYVRPELAN